MHEKEMPASQSLPFLLHVSLYHEFATQESLLSCAEFMNDKIFKHESAASVQRLDFRVTISKMQLKEFVLIRYPGVYITGKQEQNEK